MYNTFLGLGPSSTTRTPATNTTNGHHQRTSSQKFYNKFATSQCQRHLDMSRYWDMANFCPLYNCCELVRWWCLYSRCRCSGVWHLTDLYCNFAQRSRRHIGNGSWSTRRRRVHRWRTAGRRTGRQPGAAHTSHVSGAPTWLHR